MKQNGKDYRLEKRMVPEAELEEKRLYRIRQDF